ncbi:MAG: ParB/RepB/Spo0J family partition protein [Marinilabiliales bacterium]|nr:MAG: ParB/RepB/Spo0J family partition protein [Marinilabiliales bacterium]
MAAKKNALGRGLSALISEEEPSRRREGLPWYDEISLSMIEANPFQPRTRFEEEPIQELASSIRELGVIQPIIVRQKDDGRYQLIAGERRMRAAGVAGLDTIPAWIRTADDQALLEMALVENIQREDLDAIEIAISYQRLMEECSLTQENLSQRVGKKRSTISNYIRLLRLPAEIQLGIKHRQISMGHARSLISIDNPDAQLEIYNKIISNDLSVRKIEEMVRKMETTEPADTTDERQTKSEPDSYETLRDHLAGYFGTDVQFRRNEKGKGKIVIPFSSNDELERIVGLLDKLNT